MAVPPSLAFRRVLATGTIQLTASRNNLAILFSSHFPVRVIFIEVRTMGFRCERRTT
jgi:hypothetical protein